MFSGLIWSGSVSGFQGTLSQINRLWVRGICEVIFNQVAEELVYFGVIED